MENGRFRYFFSLFNQLYRSSSGTCQLSCYSKYESNNRKIICSFSLQQQYSHQSFRSICTGNLILRCYDIIETRRKKKQDLTLELYLLIILLRVFECSSRHIVITCCWTLDWTIITNCPPKPPSRILFREGAAENVKCSLQRCGCAPLSCSTSPGPDPPGRPLLVFSSSLLPLQAICSCHNKDQRGWTY